MQECQKCLLRTTDGWNWAGFAAQWQGVCLAHAGPQVQPSALQKPKLLACEKHSSCTGAVPSTSCWIPQQVLPTFRDLDSVAGRGKVSRQKVQIWALVPIYQSPQSLCSVSAPSDGTCQPWHTNQWEQTSLDCLKLWHQVLTMRSLGPVLHITLNYSMYHH